MTPLAHAQAFWHLAGTARMRSEPDAKAFSRARWLLFFLAGLGLAYWGTIYRNGGALPLPDTWRATHFFFDYFELGFVKRGLVGTLLNLPQNHASMAAIQVVSLALLAALIASFAVWLTSARVRLTLFHWALLLSPALLINWGNSVGRLDQFGFLYLFVALAALPSRPVAATFLALSPLLLFVHEAQLFLTLPTLTLAYVLVYGWRIEVLVSIGGALVSLTALLLFGGFDGEMQELIVHFLPLIPETVNGDALFVLTRSTWDSIAYTAANVSLTRLLVTGAFGLAFVAAHLAAFWFFVAGDWRVKVLAIAAALAPLVLMPIGVDWARWYSATITLVLVWLVLLDQCGLATPNVERIKKFGLPMMCAAAGLALLGPLGTTRIFAPFIDVTRALLAGS